MINKLIKLELMASVKEFDSIADVIQRFELSMINLSDEANKQLGRK